MATMEQRMIVRLHTAIGAERERLLGDPLWDGDVFAADAAARVALRSALEFVDPPGPDARRWLIWSNEHRMWWRSDGRGYAKFVDEAGRYDRVEAERHVADATCDGQLTVRRTDPVTDEDYSQLSEVLILAPEDNPASP